MGTTFTNPAPVIDLESLLRPLAPFPLGEGISDEEIQNLTRLRRGEDTLSPDWEGVIAYTTELLRTRSKDPILAAYLTEALVWKHGWTGLRDGLLLLRGLSTHNRHWELPDFMARAGVAYRWINDPGSEPQLPATLRRHVPLAHVGTRPVTWEDFLPLTHEFHPTQVSPPESVIQQLSRRHWQELLAILAVCRRESAALQDRLGGAQPRGSLLWTLEQFVHLIEYLLDEKGEALDCPEGRGFLASIQENPDDRTSYLVLADWLDEQDDPLRAEFIRLQCERERPEFVVPLQGPPSGREEELLWVHGPRWCPGLELCDVEFRHGFPATLQFTLDGWEQIPELLNQVPTIHRLYLGLTGLQTDEVARLQHLLLCPELGRLRC